jgi:hypothetical protein
MSRKRARSRPADPMEIARRRAAERERDRDPANWGLDRGALDLPANAHVEARKDAAGRLARARRQDVFDLMRARGALGQAAHDAVRRLQDDIALLHRTVAGGGDYAPRVDQTRDPQSFTDSRHRAGLRVEAVLARAGPASARLLIALIEAEVVLGRPADWREVVSRETGERLPDAQAATLRAACENLAGAYGMVAGRWAS